MGNLQIKIQPKVYDAIIVGSGAGGGMATYVLANAGNAFAQYANFASFPPVGSVTTGYIAKNTNFLYYWDGVALVYVLLTGGGGIGKFFADFGDGASLVFVIAHGLGNANIAPVLKNNATGRYVGADIVADATNITITITGTPPTLNELRLIVTG